jgi:hypothetical protein
MVNPAFLSCELCWCHSLSRSTAVLSTQLSTSRLFTARVTRACLSAASMLLPSVLWQLYAPGRPAGCSLSAKLERSWQPTSDLQKESNLRAVI